MLNQFPPSLWVPQPNLNEIWIKIPRRQTGVSGMDAGMGKKIKSILDSQGK